MRIICDFDGTISRRDTTDLVLERLADPAWRQLEDDWLGGRITAAACMRAQVALIGGSADDLDALLDTVELDPGFAGFVAWCGAQGLPVSIVSDGVDHFIARILKRHGLGHLPVVSNHLAGEAEAWRLEQPWEREGCAAGSGVCKCAAIGAWSGEAAPVTTVYVGDGRSDFCVSGRADLLFAKGALVEYAAARAQPFIPFDTFDDVTRALAMRLREAPVASRVVAL
jgi:2,3-diketo-5-methylthio-1-phosphopentane phosphatase